MKNIITCIEELRLKLEKSRKEDLKELPTRTIFIDPLLQALGWDITDPDEVELEYPTIDAKSVDYAPKINRKAALFIEAKSLNDSLTDVKAITQVVGYAANAGIDWCILTNGRTYKIYKSTEKADAPNKLLYEISIDPRESEGMTISQIADQLNRFSKESIAHGVLDEIGNQVFTQGKIRKALDKLFLDPPNNLIKIVRSTIGDELIKPVQVKEAIKKFWFQSSDVKMPHIPPKEDGMKISTKKSFDEKHHLEGKPKEIVEIFQAVDKFCRGLDPNVQKMHLAVYIKYMLGKNIFCSICIQKRNVVVYLKLTFANLRNPPNYVRDVLKIGHFGVGDVEVVVDNFDKIQTANALIKQSFEENK